MSFQFACPYCIKVCTSAGGLKQHIARSPSCREAQMQEIGAAPSISFGVQFGSLPGQNHQGPNGPITRSLRRRNRLEHLPDPPPNNADPPPNQRLNLAPNHPNQAVNDRELVDAQLDQADSDSIGHIMDIDEESESTESMRLPASALG